MFIRPPGYQPLRSVTLCRWSGVLLMSLLIAVPPEVQINTRKDRKRCSLLDDNSTATEEMRVLQVYTVDKGEVSLLHTPLGGTSLTNEVRAG